MHITHARRAISLLVLTALVLAAVPSAMAGGAGAGPYFTPKPTATPRVVISPEPEWGRKCNTYTLLAIIDHILGRKELTDEEFWHCDVTEDGFVDMRDIYGVIEIIYGLRERPIFYYHAYSEPSLRLMTSSNIAQPGDEVEVTVLLENNISSILAMEIHIAVDTSKIWPIVPEPVEKGPRYNPYFKASTSEIVYAPFSLLPDPLSTDPVPIIPLSINDGKLFSFKALALKNTAIGDKLTFLCESFKVFYEDYSFADVGPVSMESRLLGDLNRDDVVDVDDILLARDAVFGLAETTDYMLCAAGADSDFGITITNILMIRDIIFDLLP